MRKRVQERRPIGIKRASLWAQCPVGDDNELGFDKTLFSSRWPHLPSLYDSSGFELRVKPLVVVGGTGTAETTALEIKG